MYYKVVNWIMVRSILISNVYSFSEKLVLISQITFIGCLFQRGEQVFIKFPTDVKSNEGNLVFFLKCK